MRNQYSPIYKASETGRWLKLNQAQALAILAISVVLLGLLGTLLGYGFAPATPAINSGTPVTTSHERLKPAPVSTSVVSPTSATTAVTPAPATQNNAQPATSPTISISFSAPADKPSAANSSPLK